MPCMNKVLNTNTRKFKLHPSSEYVYQAHIIIIIIIIIIFFFLIFFFTPKKIVLLRNLWSKCTLVKNLSYK